MRSSIDLMRVEPATFLASRSDGQEVNSGKRIVLDNPVRRIELRTIIEYFYIHRGTLEPCAWWGNQQRH